MTWTKAQWRWALFGLLALAAAWFAYDITSAPGVPTLDEYLAFAPDRTLAPPGFTIDGTPATCAKVRIVLNPVLNDVAAAEPGFVILNPKYFDPLPGIVRNYVFGHECGHQLHGASEEMADCYAVMRGEAQGWSNANGVQAICDFWTAHASDNKHLPGPARCKLMQRCFASALAAKG